MCLLKDQMMRLIVKDLNRRMMMVTMRRMMMVMVTIMRMVMVMVTMTRMVMRMMMAVMGCHCHLLLVVFLVA